MEKKKYYEPSVRTVTFKAQDIIATSGETGGNTSTTGFNVNYSDDKQIRTVTNTFWER